MKITRIELENYKIFNKLVLGSTEDCDAPIDKRMNVIIGDNGAGKSGLLGAINLLASNYAFSLIKDQGLKRRLGYQASNLDIKNGEGKSSILLDFNFKEKKEENFQDHSISWSIEMSRERQGKPRRPKFSESRGILEKYDEFDLSDFNFPVIMHYGVERSAMEVPQRNRSDGNYIPEEQYVEMLDSKSNFRQFFEWFEEQENIENEIYRYKQILDENHLYPDGRPDYGHEIYLGAIRDAIKVFLGGFEHLRVERGAGKSFVVNKGKFTLNLMQLSQGERNLLTLVGDIGKNLSIMHPGSSNPLAEEAVILIDEIDMHLHPLWQSDILDKFMQTFPNCQFFVTTHSPLVISTADENINIIRLRDGETMSINDNLRGWSVDKVLERRMGAPAMEQDIQNQIDLIDKYLKNGQLQSAEEEFNNIEDLGNGRNSQVYSLGLELRSKVRAAKIRESLKNAQNYEGRE